ncbi:MAG: hypothetical protein SAK29_29240 [Scytonema sp. PMC 1069.18]|nr:hypothetical protein [Scytonema sp. PMC 1069.18]MEC4887391.1 hypothetical protein [Scytonema sp. PMC 1070.18]
MKTDLTSQASSDFLTVLSQATASYREQTKERPAAPLVVDALLQAEKTAKQQKLAYPFESLLGTWRLCFTTGTKKMRKRGGIVLGKGFYMPKFTPAHIAFSANSQAETEKTGRGEISNSIQLGSLMLKFEGLTQYLGKKNLLAFDFTRVKLCLFGRVIYHGNVRGGKAQAENFYNLSIAKLPFFAFFSVTEDFIAARGRGGGLALWIREN